LLEQVLIAGFGGQGVLTAGQLLAYAGMLENKHVAWIPSYGPEMRGGTANCGVTVSDKEISSPVVSEPTILMAMNRPSLEKFKETVWPGGLVLVNSSLVDIKVMRGDVRAVYVSANEIAEEIGNSKVAVNVVLGALIGLTGLVAMESAAKSLEKVLPVHRQDLIEINKKALARGADLSRKFVE